MRVGVAYRSDDRLIQDFPSFSSLPTCPDMSDQMEKVEIS